MKHIATTAALLAASGSTIFGAAQFINGNWYDSAVERVVFTGWGQGGTYDEVVSMNNGQCVKEPVTFSGGMSPLGDEVSPEPGP